VRVEEAFLRTARRQPADTARVDVQGGATTSYAQATASMEAGAETGSVGWRPTLSCEVRLAAEDGVEIEGGGIGEIWLRSESMMRGYHGGLEDTREALDEEGWLRTGDLARRDEDGYLWIGDRKKDVVISGGANVYPAEVEQVLSAHPGIAEVAVVGALHAEWG
jgi:feruloyl-CoA synthase